MSTWYRVMCDRHTPALPVCDIELDGANVAVFATGFVQVPGGAQHIDLDAHVQAKAAAIRRGESPNEAVRDWPQFDPGIVRTAHPDVLRGKVFWLTCEECARDGGKKLAARAEPALLNWLLTQLCPCLEVIEDVELRETIAYAPGEWEADPSQLRYTSRRTVTRRVPLELLNTALTRNPRGRRVADDE